MAANRILWSGNITLPSPTQITVSDEIIWSSNTGRSASGEMIGDIIASKKNVNISWGVLTEAEMALIKQVMAPGFFTISFHDDGVDLTLRAYRATLNKEVLGYIGDGAFYYRSASVSIIQK